VSFVSSSFRFFVVGTVRVRAAVGGDSYLSQIRKVDQYFEWHQKKLDDPQKAHRSAAQVALMLMGVSCEDGKSELLQTRVFALLMGEKYRSHAEVLYEFEQGGWEVSRHGISVMALEHVLQTLRRTQAYFLAMARHDITREFASVSEELRTIQSISGEEQLLQWQLTDIIPKKQETKARNWCFGASELCRELRKHFNEHNKAIAKNFQRWCGSNLEDSIQAGLCFKDRILKSMLGRG
jgi:hypothetical protein